MDEILNYLEGLEFASHANLANDFRTFIRALNLNFRRSRLYEYARNPEFAEIILDRVKALTATRSAPEYENPFDSALAAYLHVLFYANPPMAFEATKYVLDTPRLWWAEFVADTIVRTKPLIAGTSLASGNTISLTTDTTETLQPAQAFANLAAGFWNERLIEISPVGVLMEDL